jgi:Ca2+-binding EF-hand superfamily protein
MLGDEFTSLFKQIDKDKDGYISINDLKETILKKNLIK